MIGINPILSIQWAKNPKFVNQWHFFYSVKSQFLSQSLKLTTFSLGLLVKNLFFSRNLIPSAINMKSDWGQGVLNFYHQNYFPKLQLYGNFMQRFFLRLRVTRAQRPDFRPKLFIETENFLRTSKPFGIISPIIELAITYVCIFDFRHVSIFSLRAHFNISLSLLIL